jgi:lysophospholipase L1-like esterase
MTKRSVVFFGDELMLGLRDPEGFGWPQRLTRAERGHGHALVPYILGVEGDTTLDVAARWRSESEARIASLPAATLVVCTGVNDQASSADGVRVPLPDSLYAAEGMISEAASWRAVFWVGPPPVLPSSVPHPGRANHTIDYDPVRVRGLSQGFAAIAARCGVPYLDLCDLLDTADYDDALVNGTGVLPDSAGQGLIAAAIESWKPWRDWLDKSTSPNLYFAPS